MIYNSIAIIALVIGLLALNYKIGILSEVVNILVKDRTRELEKRIKDNFEKIYENIQSIEKRNAQGTQENNTEVKEGGAKRGSVKASKRAKTN